MASRTYLRSLLEKLEPEQRIVFVLREVFEHSYQSIAETIGKSEAACRQLMVRARAALDRAQQAPPESAAIASSIVTRFMDALARGGKVPSTLKPVYGPIASRGSFWVCCANAATYSTSVRLL